ncbi:MAG: glycoside hydrolase family 30 protein [Solirubrobacteraceae bacterium]
MARPRRRLCVTGLAAVVVAVVALSSTASAGTGRSGPSRTGGAPERPDPSVQVVMTSANLTWRLSRLPDLTFSADRPSGVPVVTVDDGTRYQRFSGVGAAMTDSSAWLIYDELSPGTRARLMTALFGASGIHLNFVRVPIGGSDFTANGLPYSYDDLAPGQVDPTLAHFSIAHDLAYVVPALAQMLLLNRHIEILAEPWSPPAWMKTNGAFNNKHGTGWLRSIYRGPLAQYIVKFIQAYARVGIPIDAITPQNEPGAPSDFPGLNLSAAGEVQFITQYLEPALRAAHLDTKIYGLDRGALLYYAKSLALGPARDDLAGIAWHCYGGPSYMNVLHALAPTLDQIVSECSPGIIPYTPAEALIGSLRNWASAAALWNLALDPAGGPVQLPNLGCPGCTGVVMISEQTHTVSYGLNYYQLGQISKFVAPGAVRIASNALVSDFRTPAGAYGVTPGLDDVAFRNPDGTTVLVTYNNSGSWIRFAVTASGRWFEAGIPPGAMTTFEWR